MRRRERAPIETTGELVAAIEAALPAAVRRSFGGGIPAKRVFQAVRIAVNDELDSLDRALPLAWELLREDGRLAAISFHSLEDRRVKRFLVERAHGCVCPPDFPVLRLRARARGRADHPPRRVPTPGEMADNPRSKSGKLRAARKLGVGEPPDGRAAAAARAPATARARRQAPEPRPRPAPARRRAAAAPRAAVRSRERRVSAAAARWPCAPVACSTPRSRARSGAHRAASWARCSPAAAGSS